MIENDITHKITSLTLNPSAAILTNSSRLALFTVVVVVSPPPTFLVAVCGPSSLTQRLNTTIDDGDFSEDEFVGAPLALL